MGTIKENYQIMFTTYPDVVTINQLKEMLGIGVTLAYRLVKNNIKGKLNLNCYRKKKGANYDNR